jgi:hypothetical protein
MQQVEQPNNPMSHAATHLPKLNQHIINTHNFVYTTKVASPIDARVLKFLLHTTHMINNRKIAHSKTASHCLRVHSCLSRFSLDGVPRSSIALQLQTPAIPDLSVSIHSLRPGHGVRSNTFLEDLPHLHCSPLCFQVDVPA